MSPDLKRWRRLSRFRLSISTHHPAMSTCYLSMQTQTQTDRASPTTLMFHSGYTQSCRDFRRACSLGCPMYQPGPDPPGCPTVVSLSLYPNRLKVFNPKDGMHCERSKVTVLLCHFLTYHVRLAGQHKHLKWTWFRCCIRR